VLCTYTFGWQVADLPSVLLSFLLHIFEKKNFALREIVITHFKITSIMAMYVQYACFLSKNYIEKNV